MGGGIKCGENITHTNEVVHLGLLCLGYIDIPDLT